MGVIIYLMTAMVNSTVLIRYIIFWFALSFQSETIRQQNRIICQIFNIISALIFLIDYRHLIFV